MTEDAHTESKVAFSQRPIGKLGCAITFLFLAAIVSVLIGTTIWLEVAYHVLAGWIQFLLENVGSLTFNWEMIACGIGALALGTYGLHCLCIWLRGKNPWKWQWTISISALTIVLFAASIAMTGIIHQLGWMTREPFISNSRRVHLTVNVSNAKQMFYLMVEYDEEYGALPESIYSLKKEGLIKNLYELQFYPENSKTPEPWIIVPDSKSLFSEEETSTSLPRIIMIAPQPIQRKWVALRSDGAVTLIIASQIRREHPYLLEKLPNLLPN